MPDNDFVGPLLDLEGQAEELTRQVHAAVYAPLAYRVQLGDQCIAFAEANKAALPSWRYDELIGAKDFLRTGDQPGTASDPNAYTTSAARMQTASATKGFFSTKTLDGIAEDAKKLLGVVAGEAAKKFAGNLWKIGAVLTVGFLAYAVGRKKGWI